MKRWTLWGALALASAMVAGDAQAMLIAKTNLVDLVNDADSIVVGTVTSVTDGIEPTYGLPYTEVTLSLEETIRGGQSGTFTFRQIGLMKPRLTADGTKMMAAAPEGIPRYAAGERVLLFMCPQAEMTGLQSTIGLGYGKFNLATANATNDLGNGGVFDDVSLAPSVANENDLRILSTPQGAVNQVDLLSLVRRSVQGNWTKTCKMWNTYEDAQKCGTPAPPRPVTPRPITLPTNPTQAPNAAPKISK